MNPKRVKVLTRREQYNLRNIFKKQEGIRRKRLEKQNWKKEINVILRLFFYFSILLFSMRIAFELNSKTEIYYNHELLLQILFLFLSSSLQALSSIRRYTRRVK